VPVLVAHNPADVSTWSRTDDAFIALHAAAGLRPTTTTGDPLVDGYLWVQVPGESDGQCVRGTAGPVEPARGVVDPVAGAWFPDLARELVADAEPAL
jgi:endoglucanase